MATVVFDGDVTGPDAPEAQEPEKETPNPEENPMTKTTPEEPEKKAEDAGKTGEPEKDGDEEKPDDGKRDEEVLLEVAGLDMSELSKEYAEKGELSDESYKELAENGFPREIVDAYIRGVKAGVQDETALAQRDIDEIVGLAGGEEGYGKLMKWAEGTLSQAEKDAFNKAVTGGDKFIASLAVGGLVARHEQEYGHDPELVGGSRQSSDAGSKFASRSEMVEAMSDKRYGRDSDYTKEVERKVLNSGLMRRK